MNEIRIIRAKEIHNALDGKEKMIMKIVADAYVEFKFGVSALPHSIFLRFPDNYNDRIIGLPAYLGGDYDVAAMKWISSFPANTKKNIERASAVLIMNELKHGRVKAILESSIISAKRTAASAAMAAQLVHSNKDETTIGFVGAGRISEEICRFMCAAFPSVSRFVVYDLYREHADAFAKIMQAETNVEISRVDSVTAVLEAASLTVFATTASVPYINDISACNEKSTILNISLRDFSPEVVLNCDNVVDDLDHVCREKTSIHLTETAIGNRDFVRSGIAEIITGKQPGRVGGKPVMFSPFGLGVLDLALGKYVLDQAEKDEFGVIIENFFQ